MSNPRLLLPDTETETVEAGALGVGLWKKLVASLKLLGGGKKRQIIEYKGLEVQVEAQVQDGRELGLVRVKAYEPVTLAVIYGTYARLAVLTQKGKKKDLPVGATGNYVTGFGWKTYTARRVQGGRYCKLAIGTTPLAEVLDEAGNLQRYKQKVSLQHPSGRITTFSFFIEKNETEYTALLRNRYNGTPFTCATAGYSAVFGEFLAVAVSKKLTVVTQKAGSLTVTLEHTTSTLTMVPGESEFFVVSRYSNPTFNEDDPHSIVRFSLDENAKLVFQTQRQSNLKAMNHPLEAAYSKTGLFLADTGRPAIAYYPDAVIPAFYFYVDFYSRAAQIELTALKIQSGTVSKEIKKWPDQSFTDPAVQLRDAQYAVLAEDGEWRVYGVYQVAKVSQWDTGLKWHNTYGVLEARAESEVFLTAGALKQLLYSFDNHYYNLLTPMRHVAEKDLHTTVYSSIRKHLAEDQFGQQKAVILFYINAQRYFSTWHLDDPSWNLNIETSPVETEETFYIYAPGSALKKVDIHSPDAVFDGKNLFSFAITRWVAVTSADSESPAPIYTVTSLDVSTGDARVVGETTHNYPVLGICELGSYFLLCETGGAYQESYQSEEDGAWYQTVFIPYRYTAVWIENLGVCNITWKPDPFEFLWEKSVIRSGPVVHKKTGADQNGPLTVLVIQMLVEREGAFLVTLSVNFRDTEVINCTGNIEQWSGPLVMKPLFNIHGKLGSPGEIISGSFA